MDVFYDDYDVSFAALFETDDFFYSKVNVMKSDFAYLCDVFPNSYSVCDDHFMHMFDINSTQTESFNLVTIDKPKNILLASDLTHDEREKMKEIIEKRQKVFAWGYEDMPGIDRKIAEHRIPTDPHVSPIKQKKRRLRPEWALLVKEEVEKQWKAKFLEVVEDTQWLANIVPVAKKDGKVRMCMDY